MTESKNILFFEKYKELDKLLGDMYGRKEGVTGYIDDMVATPRAECFYIHEWDVSLQVLKRLRFLRNQLAHGEMELLGDDISEGELRWIDKFYSEVMEGIDPLGLVNRARGKGPVREVPPTPMRRVEGQTAKVPGTDSRTPASGTGTKALLESIAASSSKMSGESSGEDSEERSVLPGILMSVGLIALGILLIISIMALV